MLRKIGSHPDNPNPAKSLEDAQGFNKLRTLCPKCGKQGYQQQQGHATLARITKEGKKEFFDVYCLKCRKCGELIIVFHTCYAEWLKGSNKEESEALVEKLCRPGWGCKVVSGSGDLPWDTWLPYEIMHKPIRAAGPVMITSLNSIEHYGSADKNGCGHVQFMVIGPSIEQIIRAIPKTPIIARTLRQEGKCNVCRRLLRGIVVAFEDELDLTDVGDVVDTYGRSELLKLPNKGIYREFFNKFSDDELKLAETRVIYREIVK